MIAIAKDLKASAEDKDITSNLSSLLPKIVELVNAAKSLKSDCELVPSSQNLLASSNSETINLL